MLTQNETSAKRELCAYSTAIFPSGDAQVLINAVPMCNTIPVFNALRYMYICTLRTAAVAQTHQLGLCVEL